MCQANSSASGDAVSPSALHSGEGAEAWKPEPHFHGDLLKQRALECAESPLSRELMMAGGWVNHLNDALAAARAENARLRETLVQATSRHDAGALRSPDAEMKRNRDALRKTLGEAWGFIAHGPASPMARNAMLMRMTALLNETASPPRPDEEAVPADTETPHDQQQLDTNDSTDCFRGEKPCDHPITSEDA